MPKTLKKLIWDTSAVLRNFAAKLPAAAGYDDVRAFLHHYNHSFRCAQAQNVMKMVACALSYNWSYKYTTQHGEVSASPYPSLGRPHDYMCRSAQSSTNKCWHRPRRFIFV